MYFGGESEPARRLAARDADVFFINGRPLPEVAELIEDLRRRPRERDPLRFGLAAFVIARPVAEEAHAEFERLLALSARDDRSRLVSGTDKDVAMMKVGAGVPRVGTNGGTLAGLVGSYDEVADRIAAFSAAGIELFMLQFQPLEAEVVRFGSEVIPRVRERSLSDRLTRHSPKEHASPCPASPAPWPTTRRPARSASSGTRAARCRPPPASPSRQGWLDDEFAPDGIAVASLRSSTDDRVRESHFDHTQADSFRQGGNIPPIWTRSRGSDVRLIGLSWAAPVPGDRGAPGQRDRRAGGAARARRVGIARRVNDQIDFWHATSLRGFDSTLRHVGLSLDDVAIVDLPVDERYLRPGFSAAERESHSGSLFGAYTNRRLQRAEVLALIRGEVDAIYVAGGRGPDLEALVGVDVVFDLAGADDQALGINNITPAALTVSGAAARRPSRPRRPLRGRDAARGALGQRTTPSRPGASSRTRSGSPRTSCCRAIRATSTRISSRRSSRSLVAAIESQQAFLLEHGYIEQAFDVGDWIDAGPLDAAHALLAAEPV